MQLTPQGTPGDIKILFYTDPFKDGPAMCGQADTGGESINLDGLQAGTYYLRVYGYAAEGYTLSITSTSSWPVTVAASAPTNVQASTGYADHILVSWTAAANATSYQVWSSQTDDSSTATLLADNVTGSTYSDTTATGTTYYWIKAVNTVGTSDFSAAATGDLGQVTAVNETANDGYADPMDLGTLAGPTQVNGKLDTADQVDWFKFTTTAAGTVDSSVQLTFTGSAGDMKVLFYTDPFKKGPALYGTAAAGSDTIPLDSVPAGTYWLRVYGGIAGDYSLTVTP